MAFDGSQTSPQGFWLSIFLLYFGTEQEIVTIEKKKK